MAKFTLADDEAADLSQEFPYALETPAVNLPQPPASIPASDGTTPYGVYDGALPTIDYKKFCEINGWSALDHFFCRKKMAIC